MNSAIIYPGTFDPITNGHHDLIIRAANIFSKVIVAVAFDSVKQALLPAEERVKIAQAALHELTNVEVCGFHGLLVEFARQRKVTLVLRGARVVADFEYERQLAGMNQSLAPELETIFLIPHVNYAHISSTFVRDIARLGGDVSAFVPTAAARALNTIFSE